MLHILKNTDLAAYYEEHPFDVFTLDSYVDLLLKWIENRLLHFLEKMHL